MSGWSILQLDRSKITWGGRAIVSHALIMMADAPATKNEQLRELAARAKVPLRTALPFPPLLLPLPERVYTPRNTLAISL